MVAIKTFHTAAWFSIEACVCYVLYTGLVGRTNRHVGTAAAVVAGESLVFAANGFRCPLTELAERYVAERGSVTDVYLPDWFAHNIPAIHAPLLPLMAYLHLRNLRRASARGQSLRR
ncbi:membrane protein [Intrasporangium chromatireducens Q5-1]|uniref:Membrane protein n=1 Tax=Intrasporangium chromatireducens Q5-1 TaxID=584657 RepID=W9GIV8_9MICO|nr:membrane protein [Intrasporangium chromatireducens Q5-1]